MEFSSTTGEGHTYLLGLKNAHGLLKNGCKSETSVVVLVTSVMCCCVSAAAVSIKAPLCSETSQPQGGCGPDSANNNTTLIKLCRSVAYRSPLMSILNLGEPSVQTGDFNNGADQNQRSSQLTLRLTDIRWLHTVAMVTGLWNSVERTEMTREEARDEGRHAGTSASSHDTFLGFPLEDLLPFVTAPSSGWTDDGWMKSGSFRIQPLLFCSHVLVRGDLLTS